MLHDCLQHFYVGGRKAKQNIQAVQNLGNIRQCTPKYFHTDVSAPRYDSGRANVARQCFHFWSRKVFKNGLIHSGQGAGGYHDEENWTLGIMASHPPRHFMFAGRQKCQWGPEQRTHDFCVEKLAQTSVWQLISIPLAPTITSVRCGCCFACRKKEKNPAVWVTFCSRVFGTWGWISERSRRDHFFYGDLNDRPPPGWKGCGKVAWENR